MSSYLALLRGVNVGGKGMIKMAELQAALEKAGFDDVHTYIQSGNVLFRSTDSDTRKLAQRMHDVIQKTFGLEVEVVVLSRATWQKIIRDAPKWWGNKDGWKHNLLVLIPPFSMPEAAAAIGELKPEIEAIEPGHGVLYQSMSIALFGRTTTGKLASNPIYKKMTIRNYNTATKLVKLLDEMEATKEQS